MAAKERRRGGGFKTAFEITWGVLTFAVILIIAYPRIKSTLQAIPLGTITIFATSVPATQQPITQPQSGNGGSVITISNPINVPTQTLAQVEATSQAIYHATVQAVEAQPQPNVNNTGDSAPVVRAQKESALEPASGVVPTAEPIQPAQSDGSFGSKPAKPVNVQETHQCLHGQVWVDGRGCKNPTPTN